MRVGVIGPAGFGGSYLCLELINRGYTVVGISRHPEKLGTHKLYEPRPADVDTLSIRDLATKFEDLDVLVSEYGPHTAGADALQYMPFLETVRKIVLAVKRSKVSYFIMVGGTGSLHIPKSSPDDDDVCAVDSEDFWTAYRRGIADSEAHTSYMEERLGPIGDAIRKYRNARHRLREGKDTAEDREYMAAYEEKVRKDDRAKIFIQAGRTSFLFFDGNTSFRWTYVSPSALYRPGKRTGTYEVVIADLPLRKDRPVVKGNLMEGRLCGISVADLAVAIADEVKDQKYQGLHWTAVADLSDDTPTPSYVTLDGK